MYTRRLVQNGSNIYHRIAKRGQKRPSTIYGESAREPWLTRELTRPVVMKREDRECNHMGILRA